MRQSVQSSPGASFNISEGTGSLCTDSVKQQAQGGTGCKLRSLGTLCRTPSTILDNKGAAKAVFEKRKALFNTVKENRADQALIIGRSPQGEAEPGVGVEEDRRVCLPPGWLPVHCSGRLLPLQGQVILPAAPGAGWTSVWAACNGPPAGWLLRVRGLQGHVEGSGGTGTTPRGRGPVGGQDPQTPLSGETVCCCGWWAAAAFGWPRPSCVPFLLRACFRCAGGPRADVLHGAGCHSGAGSLRTSLCSADGLLYWPPRYWCCPCSLPPHPGTAEFWPEVIASLFSPPGFLALAIADESLGTCWWSWFSQGNGTAAWSEVTVPLGARKRPFQVGGCLQFPLGGAWGACGCSCTEEGRGYELHVPPPKPPPCFFPLSLSCWPWRISMAPRHPSPSPSATSPS